MKNKNYFILLVLFLSALQIKAQYSFDNVLMAQPIIMSICPMSDWMKISG